MPETAAGEIRWAQTTTTRQISNTNYIHVAYTAETDHSVLETQWPQLCSRPLVSAVTNCVPIACILIRILQKSRQNISCKYHDVVRIDLVPPLAQEEDTFANKRLIASVVQKHLHDSTLALHSCGRISPAMLCRTTPHTACSDHLRKNSVLSLF